VIDGDIQFASTAQLREIDQQCADDHPPLGVAPFDRRR